MIPTASIVIRGSGQPITASVPAAFPQSEFADALEHSLAGIRHQDVDADSIAADLKAILTQRCKALTALINRRLAEGDNALDNNEMQPVQVLQQWPADGDTVLTKLGIAPASSRDQRNGEGLVLTDPGAEAPFSLTAVAPESTDIRGKKEQQLLLMPTAKRNACRAANTPLRLDAVNIHTVAAHPRTHGEVPLRSATPADKLALTAAHTLPALPSTGLEAITTDPPSQRTPAPPPVPIAHLRQPLGSPTRQQQLGEHIILFNRSGVFHAQLHLHPRELGAMTVNLCLNKEQLQVHFASDNQQVRAVLETAMTQLRTSLVENGIALGDTSVGTDGSGHDTSGHQQGRGDSPQHGPARYRSLFGAHRNGGVPAGSGAWYRDGIDIYA